MNNKCPSCGGRLDRLYSVCPVCGNAFKCQLCNKVLKNNESNMCKECKTADTVAKAEAVQDISRELQNACNEISSILDNLE